MSSQSFAGQACFVGLVAAVLSAVQVRGRTHMCCRWLVGCLYLKPLHTLFE